MRRHFHADFAVPLAALGGGLLLGTALLPAPAWAQSAVAPSSGRTASGGAVRIVQTNSAGDNVHIIDPVANEVVGVIEGIPKAHGVAAAPDGGTLYFSNEIDRTLEIVPTDVMRVVDRIPLSGRPHNVAISLDGRKVYVAIIQDCSCVDIVDLEAGEVVKSIPTRGTVHNVFMSPDGRHVAAGMIGARTLTIIDTSIDEAIWSLHFSGRTTGGYADGGGAADGVRDPRGRIHEAAVHPNLELSRRLCGRL